MRQLLSRIGRWLNKRLNIISDDPYYDWADQKLDGLRDDTFEEYLSKRTKDF